MFVIIACHDDTFLPYRDEMDTDDSDDDDEEDPLDRFIHGSSSSSNSDDEDDDNFDYEDDTILNLGKVKVKHNLFTSLQQRYI